MDEKNVGFAWPEYLMFNVGIVTVVVLLRKIIYLLKQILQALNAPE
jgi:hypothetical protein